MNALQTVITTFQRLWRTSRKFRLFVVFLLLFGANRLYKLFGDKKANKSTKTDASDFSIEGYVAVVTGAADGIGKGICYKFAKEGINLAMIDINEDKLNEVTKDLKSLYPEITIHSFICDVSNENQIYELVDKVKKAFNTNTIQILFNNAGIWYVEILNGDINKLRKTMDVNLWSIIYATRAFKEMLLENEENKQCYIVNTGSMASVITPDNMYGVTKHAVIALSEAISAEFKKQYPKNNILVTTLTPLFVKSNLMENSKKQLKNEEKNENPQDMDPNFIKLWKATEINIDECAEIIYDAMKAKQTVIPTEREFFEAAIKDRMDGLLACTPNSWINWTKSMNKLNTKQ